MVLLFVDVHNLGCLLSATQGRFTRGGFGRMAMAAFADFR